MRSAQPRIRRAFARRERPRADKRLYNLRDMQKRDQDESKPLPALPALDLLAEPTRRRIVWELSHQPRTVTELARLLRQSQPLVSKHLRALRQAGLVDAQPDPDDGRTRRYDIRREHLIQLHGWLQAIQQNWWTRTRHTPINPDYYKDHGLDPNLTTRGTPRKRNLRRLKDPWER